MSARDIFRNRNLRQRHKASTKIQAVARGRSTRRSTLGKALTRVKYLLSQIMKLKNVNTPIPNVDTYDPEDPPWMYPFSKRIMELTKEVRVLEDAISTVEDDNREMRRLLKQAGIPFDREFNSP